MVQPTSPGTSFYPRPVGVVISETGICKCELTQAATPFLNVEYLSTLTPLPLVLQCLAGGVAIAPRNTACLFANEAGNAAFSPSLTGDWINRGQRDGAGPARGEEGQGGHDWVLGE